MYLLLQDQGSPQMSSDFVLNVVVMEAAIPPPTFPTLVYSASSPEADHTTSVSP